MTQTAWKKKKAARHAESLRTHTPPSCRAAFSVNPGKVVIPSEARNLYD
jgi:hypothetical protein